MARNRYATEVLTKALPALMAERNISFRELATATSLSGGYLNHIVHGKRAVPSDEVLGRIAVALEVEPDYFLETRIRTIVRHMDEQPALVNRLYKQAVASE
jgi:transcriptional regulator with XRE-family HTH domain